MCMLEGVCITCSKNLVSDLPIVPICLCKPRDARAIQGLCPSTQHSSNASHHTPRQFWVEEGYDIPSLLEVLLRSSPSALLIAKAHGAVGSAFQGAADLPRKRCCQCPGFYAGQPGQAEVFSVDLRRAVTQELGHRIWVRGNQWSLARDGDVRTLERILSRL